MSYETLVGPPAVISFYYTVDNLFNIDSLWSMYKAENKLTESGESLVERFAITEDERDIFLSMLSDGVFDIFTRLLKYTKGITDAIKFNESYTPDAGVAADSVVVQILDNEAYNANYIKPVDKVLEKCLRYYVLKEWFMLKDLDSDAEKANAQYINNINLLLRHSMQLKKPSVTY